MKRTVFCLTLLFITNLSILAQNRLDLASQAMVRRAKMAEKSLPSNSKIKLLQHDQAYPLPLQSMIALVKLNDGATAQELSDDGFKVKSLRGGFAVVTCSANEAPRLASHKSVKKCEFNRQRTLKMDKARHESGIDMIHEGLGLPQAYTGKGVITGIVDGGFDPNHINFKDATGNSRFKYFSTVDVNQAGTSVRITPYNSETLKNFTTDDNTQTHGTHTLGIMAGSFMGKGTVGVYDAETDKATVSTTQNPYYGVAYNSTIYASSGASYDALIAYAVDGILEERWYNDHDTPIVINLSLGGNQGPHDGSGMLTQFLDAVTVLDKAIICLSAGNEGDIPIAYHQTFSEDGESFATFIRPYVYNDVRYGMIEFYSDSADDFDLSVIIYNKARKKIARTFPLNNKEGQIQYICSDASHQQDATDIIDATLAKAYKGYIGVGGMLDTEESGRFYAAIDFYLENSDENPADPNTTEAQYTVGFMVTGKKGQRVDCYSDGMFTALDSYGYEGFVDGSCNGTISDIATGKKTISVGSYNTKEWAGSIYGQPLGYDGAFKYGDVTSYSSYGTLTDDRNLPHLLAPGCMVVSSMSTPYLKNSSNGVSDQITCVRQNDGRRFNYFFPEMGTSMASPVVAGTVALMLEADPTLDAVRAREILMRTAIKDEATARVPDPVQAGAGKLNAHEALKATIEEGNAIRDVHGEAADRILLSPTGLRSFNICMPTASHIDAELFSTSGTKVAIASAQGNETNMNVAHLTPGIYLLRVNGGKAQKIVIK